MLKCENPPINFSCECISIMKIMSSKATFSILLWAILFISCRCKSYSVVLCNCGPDEVVDDIGECQPWRNGTTVSLQDRSGVQQVNTKSKELNVTIHEPQCDYQQVDLQEAEFTLRRRKGDLFVTEGKLRGLQVVDYCIHHQQDGEQVNVTAKGCVNMPIVRQCCDVGKHLVNGECVTKSTTPIPFKPALFTGPHGDMRLAGAPLPWADLKVHTDKPICEPGHVMKKIELDGNKTYLSALPQGVVFTWLSKIKILQQNYCVDGPEDNGTYYAYACQADKGAYCSMNMCTNKCCPEGLAWSVVNSTYSNCLTSELPFSSHNSLTKLIGSPNCTKFHQILTVTLLQDGTLIHRRNRNKRYPFDKFCTDNFIREDNSSEIMAWVCVEPETLWEYARNIILPKCNWISIAFLSLLFLLHTWMPKLREKEGMYHLCHATSLLVGISIMVVFQVLVPEGYDLKGCVYVVFISQFGVLAAFFWINVMCIDLWRNLRSLVIDMSLPISPVAAWKYMLYAFGGPLIITMITIIVQFAAPKDDSIPWLIHPHIGEDRCWFRDGYKELHAYLYGPIAGLFMFDFIFIGFTYHYVRIIHHREHKSVNEAKKTSDNFAVFWPQFYLLVLVTGCWTTEYLSLIIPPKELWAFPDILNSLQGVAVFFVFLTNHEKRAVLKENLPKILQISNILITHANSAHRNINPSNKSQPQNVSKPSDDPGTPLPETQNSQTIHFKRDNDQIYYDNALCSDYINECSESSKL